MSINKFAHKAGRKILDSVWTDRYDRKHRLEAMQAVRIIEQYNSQKLSKKHKARADQYAIDILGSKKYSPWLYVYTLVKGEFREGWIPDNYFGKLIAPEVNKDIRICTRFKTFSNVILNTGLLPDIGYHIDGHFYNREYELVTRDVLAEIIFNSCDVVFVKKDRSQRGKGVIKLTKKEFDQTLFQKIGNCVIQLPIKQNIYFDEIIPGSVATIRITTVKDLSGKTDYRAAYLRLGRLDTPWVQSANSIRAAILNIDGELDEFGYTEDWRRWTNHPDTDYSFKARKIPGFRMAVKECVQLHKKVPHLTIIGWDVAVDDEENIKIMEWNSGHCDIKFSEASTGPCFTGLGWENLWKKG